MLSIGASPATPCLPVGSWASSRSQSTLAATSTSFASEGHQREERIGPVAQIALCARLAPADEGRHHGL